MLRTPATSLLRSSLARASSRSSSLTVCRAASTHAISKPTLANIEKRWEGMPLQEQADLWMSLRDRMKENWAELTLHEKRAAYWIAFGPHGPRALPPPGEGKKVALYTAVGVGVSLAFFVAIRMFAGPAPHTMTKEWQEASNEYLKSQKADPFTGVASEGYTGKGMVQSPPKSA
ncbi:putative cytochrome c oxidase [Phialemonium atrogriseum]|uniref:Cytochrome c oxidase polypeptide V n=1 Tax=Phialemonium atrogriseum TaxID=1093897 RepID=A0AAJ0C9L8_9PEZI|nr:putative cytochrome c oxidase [Phialemonium atrogriseum]KAK1772700.1 putative cytochrome c oxidase [Phialemonium atrogriseum]